MSDDGTIAHFDEKAPQAYKRFAIIRYFDGEKWSRDQYLPENTTSVGPSLAVITPELANPALCCFESATSSASNGRMMATKDGLAWYAVKHNLPKNIRESAIVAYTPKGGQPSLYVFASLPGGNSWSSSKDAETWNTPQQIPTDILAAKGQHFSAAVFRGEIIVACAGEHEPECASFDGSTWKKLAPTDAVPYGQPNISVVDDTLYNVTPDDDGKKFQYQTYDGKQWSEQTEIPTIRADKISAGLMGTFDGSTLVCVTIRIDETLAVLNSSTSTDGGTTWSEPLIIGQTLSADQSRVFSLATFRKRLYCAIDWAEGQ
ncbi:sialidase family protein [Spirillospora sp. NPDC052269]